MLSQPRIECALWLKDLVDAVATTCGDVDLGTYWITRVLCAESHAELHDVGGLGTLDNKLRTALNKVIPLEMKNELEILERKYEEQFEKVRGREILFFIDKEFKVDQIRYQIFSKQSLFQLELRDNNLHKYVMDWNKILSTLNEPPPEEEMQTFFWEQIQKCNVQRWREKVQPLLIKTSMDP